MSRRIDSDVAVTHLAVALTRGSLSLSPTDGDTITGRVDGPGAENLAEHTGGGRLSLLTAGPGSGPPGFGGAAGAEVHLQLYVPDGIGVDIRTGNADVSADVRLGDVSAGLGAGTLRLAAVNRLTVQSGSGEIFAESVADRSRIGSGSGDIRIGWMAGGSVKSGSGRITVEGLTGGLRARTGSGDVVVGIADGLPVWLDLNSRSGAVDIDLDQGDRPEAGQPYAEVQVRTASGDISVHR